VAIKTLQSRLTQVGVIRLGEQRVSQRGKKYPAKLDTLRFTSPSKPLIDAVAGLYGGQVKAWQAPTGPQWEVITDTKEVPVLVPPQRIDPNLEHWGNGYQDRMCDGETEQIRKAPCLCAAVQASGQRFDPRDLCKPTTRMSLMLADIPSLGTWKLESKGWNAAAELPTLAASIESAPQPIPARLEVQVREKKTYDPRAEKGKEVESRVFMVPVLHFNWITPAQAFGGELGTAARAALGAAGQERQAIEAAKVESERRKLMPDEYITLAGEARNIEQVRALWTDAAHDDALTDEVKAKLQARVDEIKAATAPPAAETLQQAATGPRVNDVVDAEVVPNADEVWSQIQTVAGAKKWNADELEHRVQQQLNKSSDLADGFELTRFFEAVKSGEIQ
jgi:Recombination directionality factor-like